MYGIPCDGRSGRAMAVERSDLERVWPTHLFVPEAGELLDAGQTPEAVLGVGPWLLGVGDVGDEVGELGAAGQGGAQVGRQGAVGRVGGDGQGCVDGA